MAPLQEFPPALLRLYKNGPTSLERHSCSSDSPSRPQACIPLPCRGSGHLGKQKKAAERQRGNHQ
uniref:Uncharacterized protein n=1 Tax=Cynoglossus semilaevis TaxID=244447 RepID=A0A3P8W5J6_CYNSE